MEEAVLAEHFKRHIQQWSSNSNCTRLNVKHCFTPSYTVDYVTDCNLSITTPLSKREIWFNLNGTILKTIIYDHDISNYHMTEECTVVHKSVATSGVPLGDDVQTVISSQTMVDIRNPNSISEAEQQLTTALNDITGLEVMDIKGELEVIMMWT